MTSFDDLFYFEAVVRHRGFGTAARSLGVAKSLLSRRIKALEAELDVRLLERSTHRFEVTEIGQRFYRHCQAAVLEMEAAEEVANAMSAEPRGTVRVSCPPGICADALAAALPTFLDRHPKVRVQFVVEARRTDLIEEHIDVAIRVGFHDNESDLVVKRLRDVPGALVASPALLERYGTPQQPEDLTLLPALGRDSTQADETWVLHGPDGERREVRVRPRFSSNSLSVVLQMALQGGGIAFLPELTMGRKLGSGELVRVLPEWQGDEGVLHFAFISRRGMLPSVRLFIDFAHEELSRLLSACRCPSNGSGTHTPLPPRATIAAGEPNDQLPQQRH
ncbi:LysR substrate-binding domain-containing protein [Mangrovicella endophytica]|uniref:LysR substrate-binding domain-containing protein n=1 Tax=Mangrovicella endophytica TaxID=2066697 RepID=UPI0018E4064C|nr:LysR substrate-binding domain-containing protein [Mangrovicella endophytica]